MSMQRTAGFSAVRAILLILLMIAAVLLVRDLASGLSATGRIVAAMQRIIDIALADSAQTSWLIVLCAGAGLAVFLDRRRRSKTRQASS